VMSGRNFLGAIANRMRVFGRTCYGAWTGERRHG